MAAAGQQGAGQNNTTSTTTTVTTSQSAVLVDNPEAWRPTWVTLGPAQTTPHPGHTPVGLHYHISFNIFGMLHLQYTLDITQKNSCVHHFILHSFPCGLPPNISQGFCSFSHYFILHLVCHWRLPNISPGFWHSWPTTSVYNSVPLWWQPGIFPGFSHSLRYRLIGLLGLWECLCYIESLLCVTRSKTALTWHMPTTLIWLVIHIYLSPSQMEMDQVRGFVKP